MTKQSLGIKGKYPGVEYRIRSGDRRMLYSFIKHKNLALAEYLDKFNASASCCKT